VEEAIKSASFVEDKVGKVEVDYGFVDYVSLIGGLRQWCWLLPTHLIESRLGLFLSLDSFV
jgi:hypothetical protein